MKSIIICSAFILSACSPPYSPRSVYVDAPEWRISTQVAVKWWNEQMDLVGAEHVLVISYERETSDLVLTSSSGVGMLEATAWYVEHEAKIYITPRVWIDGAPTTVIAHELGHYLGLNHIDPLWGNNVLTPAISCWLYDVDDFENCPNLTAKQLVDLDLFPKNI